MNDIRAGGGCTVLVVDDTALNRQLLAAMLKKMGHVAVPAEDGLQALELFDRQPFDLVLMDVSMPGINGYEVVREMRKRAQEWIPIVFISANTSNDNVVEGMRAGGDDYLFKPINFEILNSKLDVLIARSEMSRQVVEQNKRLLDFKEHIQEERETAMHLMEQFSAVGKIQDPHVRFHLQAAEHFSGDLISVARTPDNRLHVLLADSAGHGLTSALAVIPLTQPFHQMTAKGFEIPAIVTEINRRVRDYLRLPRFVSAVLLSVDSDRRIIQVWNGGCPPVLLTQPGSPEAVHTFSSHHLPLGILKPEEFDANVENYVYGNQAGRLFMCSDGVSELQDAEGQPLGLQGLLRRVHDFQSDAAFDGLVGVIRTVLAGGEPLDDNALLMVDVGGDVDNVGDDAAHPGAPGMVAQQASVDECLAGDEGEPEWNFSVQLHAHQIKRMDIVPFLLGITSQIENSRRGSKLFLVLSELFNNALDHGLLQLDSELKSGDDGMERYFEMRRERLATLEQGEIAISMSKLTYSNCGSCEHSCREGYIKISFRDSGPGFDYAAMEARNMERNMQRHGRGIPLLYNLCRVVKFSGNGSEVTVFQELDEYPPR